MPERSQARFALQYLPGAVLYPWPDVGTTAAIAHAVAVKSAAASAATIAPEKSVRVNCLESEEELLPNLHALSHVVKALRSLHTAMSANRAHETPPHADVLPERHMHSVELDPVLPRQLRLQLTPPRVGAACLLVSLSRRDSHYVHLARSLDGVIPWRCIHRFQ